jgi:hypothetical protein
MKKTSGTKQMILSIISGVITINALTKKNWHIKERHYWKGVKAAAFARLTQNA